MAKTYHNKSAEDKDTERAACGRVQSCTQTTLRERQLKENEAKSRPKQVESQCTKFVASLPPNPLKDFRFMGISRIPIRNAIQKGPLFASAQVEAHAAAAEEVKEVAVDKTKMYKKKAQSRFHQTVNRKKTVKRLSGNCPALVQHCTATLDENAAGQAAEGILRRREENRGNTSLIKKKAKKAARLSIGKTRSSRTSKGTLTTKQTVPVTCNMQQQIRERTRKVVQRSCLRLQQNSNLLSAPTDPISLESSASPVTFSSLASTSDSRDTVVEKVLVKTRDISTQTAMSFQGFSTKNTYSHLSSGTSYVSTPLAQATLRQTRSTQTYGSVVTMYQKYLWSGAPNMQKLFSRVLDAPVPPAAKCRLETDPVLSVDTKRLEKKHILKETPFTNGPTNSNSALGTVSNSFVQPPELNVKKVQPSTFFLCANDFFHAERRVNAESATANPSQNQRVTHSPRKPVASATSQGKATDGLKNQKVASRNIASKQTTPKSKTQNAKIPVQNINAPSSVCIEKKSQLPTDTLVDLLLPITITVENPESRLVYISPQQSGSPPNSRATAEDPFSRLLPQRESLAKSSPEQRNYLNWSPTSAPTYRCKLDKEFFRLPPPASLPLGWRQIQSPHELSTILERDTPHSSFFDGSRSHTNTSQVDNQTVPNSTNASGKIPSNSASVGQIHLWEEILPQIFQTSTSPIEKQDLQLSRATMENESLSPRSTRFPSQSTPIKEGSNSDLEELEAGIQEQSFISLIGSEVTARVDEHRVPDNSQSLSALMATTDAALYAVIPAKSQVTGNTRNGNSICHQKQAKRSIATDSMLSFLRHEASCALSPSATTSKLQP